MSDAPDDDVEAWDEDGDVSPGPPDPNALRQALRSLVLLGEDPYLSMQVTNLALIDAWLTDVETDLMREYAMSERTPLASAHFLSAQAQMWIFAAYELLRTWRGRAKLVQKLDANAGLPLKIAALRRPERVPHFGRHAYADQLERFLDEPGRIQRLTEDLRRTHIPFRRMEAVRVSLGKHEVVGRPNAMAYAPGYGRIDRFTGSIRFQVSSGMSIYDEISRRDLADELRAMVKGPAPEQGELDAFDTTLKDILSDRLIPTEAEDPERDDG